MPSLKRLVNWIEIPVSDIERAVKFYSGILGGIKFKRVDRNGTLYALFPSKESHNAGALVQGAYYKPSSDGVTIYLDGGKDLDEILKRVEKCGGEVIMKKTYFGKEAGYVGMFTDSEGNKIGLQHP